MKEMRYEKKVHPHPFKPKLKRALGFWQATICGIGIILGAGIYALIGVAAGIAGPALWLSFLIAGIIAGLTGLSYAELSSIFKKDAAEYDYTKKAFNKKIAFVIAIMMILAALFTAATVAIGFGGYFASIFNTNIIVIAILLILALSVVNLTGIKESAMLNTIFTIIEAAGLLFIIFIGIKHWGTVDLLYMPNGFSGVLQAGALVFFSYIGFQSIVKLTEETKKPTKNIPKAILFSIVFSTIIYVLVAISAVSVVNWQALSTSAAPLADVAGTALGGYTFLIIAIIALFSTTNTVLMDIVTTSRAFYGMAKMNAFPKILGKVSHKTKTPHYAIAAVALIIICMIFIENLEQVASLGNFFTFITFAIINFTVIVLRKTHKVKRPFKVPGMLFGIPILPVLGTLSSLGMLYFVFQSLL
jgi:basic amino acid/polyamine antiporter, APA family